MDNTAPTLILTECLLIYLLPDAAEKILKWCGEFFSGAPFVGALNYEMIEPFDLFGQTMVNNLRDRGCDLLGIEHCPTLQSQIDRMEACLGTGASEGAEQNSGEHQENGVQENQADQH